MAESWDSFIADMPKLKVEISLKEGGKVRVYETHIMVENGSGDLTLLYPEDINAIVEALGE